MNKIQQFHALHTSEELLFLGNAWDMLSAVALERAGFKAIGTTSWELPIRLDSQMESLLILISM